MNIHDSFDIVYKSCSRTHKKLMYAIARRYPNKSLNKVLLLFHNVSCAYTNTVVGFLQQLLYPQPNIIRKSILNKSKNMANITSSPNLNANKNPAR